MEKKVYIRIKEMADTEGRHYKEVGRALVPESFVNINKNVNCNGEEYILPFFTELGRKWAKETIGTESYYLSLYDTKITDSIDSEIRFYEDRLKELKRMRDGEIDFVKYLKY